MKTITLANVSAREILLALLFLPLAALHAQFSPATGPVDAPVSFIQGTGPNSSGSFTVTRANANPLRLTIQRPGLSDYVHNATCLTGDTCQLSYAFVGSSGLLIKQASSNSVDVRHVLSFINMATTPSSSPATGMINRQYFTTDSANFIISANSDRLVIFTRIVRGPSNLQQGDEVTLWRGDTGASICGAGVVNLQPSDQLAANVSGTSVTITLSGSNLASCPLPVANLTVNPTPVAFGQIVSNTTTTLTVTLANPGTDPVTVSAIAASGHFAPQGFMPVTINPGNSSMVTILFNPSGAAGNFDETLAITRTPAVGAATVRCTGSAVAPVPNIQINPANLAFGTVNVGNTPAQTFRVRNTGQLALAVNSVTGPATAVYTLAPPAGFTTPASIAPGGQTGVFTVTFAPTAAGAFADAINVASNDPDTPTATLSLNGTGHVPAADFFMDPSVTNLNYGDVETGYRFGKGVRIVNRGDLDLSFTVEVLGDNRFTFSQTPNVPGPGVRGPVSITIPASPLGGPFNEQILRVTFDGLLPEANGIYGTLRISGIINDPTPPPTPITIALSGNVVAAKTLDVALTIDRSGSMNEPMAVGTKIQAVRSGSELFFNLLRDNVGDRASITQFNTAASTLQPMTALPPAIRQTFINLINNPANLVPNGSTSIAAGLLDAFAQLNDPTRQVRAALIVSDGKENMPAVVGGQNVTLSNIQVPAGIGVHSLCLGTAANTDLARLTDIANRTGGSALATDNVSQLGVFDIEKYFLQVATTIAGGTTTLDPVSTIHAGQTQTWQVGLIPADKAVTFVLLFKDGALPFRILAPDGTQYPIGSPPAGFGQSFTESPNARIVQLSLPTLQPPLYEGNWQIEVMHGLKIERYGKDGKRYTESIRDPVTYAVAVSVNSNLRLLPLLSPQPLHPGDPITVTAFLTEEEVPVLGASIETQVKRPDTTIWGTLHLHDDGTHNDGASNDGEYAGVFTATQQTGAYTFNYHATGSSARGGPFVREAVLSQYVQPVNPPPGGDDPHIDDFCCTQIVWWLRVLVILILVLAVLAWLVCCRNRNP